MLQGLVPQLQYQQICKLLAYRHREPLSRLHNWRTVNVLFPKLNQSLFLIGNRIGWSPEMTRDHFLVKRKLSSLFSRYENAIAAAEGVAEFDKAVRPFPCNVNDCYRCKMQAL